MDQLVTRQGDLFQISNRRGDLSPDGAISGLFMHDTRFLSRFELYIDWSMPKPKSASTAHAYSQKVHQTAGSLRIDRERLLYQSVMYERIRITNPDREPARAQVLLQLASDFADLFELRGYPREHRGEDLAPKVGADRLTFGYQGRDAIHRETEIRFLTTPTKVTADRAVWELSLAPKESVVLDVLVLPTEDGPVGSPLSFDGALGALQACYTRWHEIGTRFSSDSDLLNRVLARSVLDLRLLANDIGYGAFFVAGIPWFAVPFGRDSLLTALFALPFNPKLAHGTLRTMAALQGQTVNPRRIEEPGKIPHELRFGEMANLDEVPFKRYYGSVDATPLFLVLACEYYAWTGDLAAIQELLPQIKAAIGWLDQYGDADGDGLLEYRSDDGFGLKVQSWKDSHDSMSHRDGRPAASPVAVSEVQGYVYDAKRRLAPILARLGEVELAERLAQEAEALKARFNQAYWMADRQFYAIALDGEKQQVGTVASDIGHCLWSGIVDEARAADVAKSLLSPALFSGWGIRTLSSAEATYDPASYHNGSVWPHDNALTALGLKRYGFDQAVAQVATGLIEAAGAFPQERLPELFCGDERSEGVPVKYPVACSPQAWAAAAPIALVQAMLGLEPSAAEGVLRLRPALPVWLGRLSLQGLRVGGARVDLEVTPAGVSATVTEGELQVIVEARA